MRAVFLKCYETNHHSVSEVEKTGFIVSCHKGKICAGRAQSLSREECSSNVVFGEREFRNWCCSGGGRHLQERLCG